MNSLSGRRIFITGATGFVGSNLVRRCLEKGAEVSINVRKSSATWRINDIIRDVSTYPVDITDYENLNDSIRKIRPDVIFHTAVYGGTSSQSDIEKIFLTNILGTERLLRSCNNIDYDLFVNTGSSSEYGIKSNPMQEIDLLEPITYYGVSKAAATTFCQAAAKSEIKPIVTLRLFSPYGKYEQSSRLIPSLILAALNKINPRISSHKFVRDFIYIDDVLDAYEAVTYSHTTDPNGRIYNIGSGQQTCVGKVVEEVIKNFDIEIFPETGLPQAWKNEPTFWQANIEKAKVELKWNPKNSISEGIAKTVEWFKQNQMLYA